MENINKILEKIGYINLKDLGSHWQSIPLYRPSDNRTALAIKKNDGAYYDFVEKRGGSFTELIQRTLKLPSYDEAQKLIEDCGFVVENKSKDYETHIVMQKTFDKSILSKLIKKHDYWIKRGISEKTLQLLEGGITFNGRMMNRYVFPILNQKDELVGFAGRILEDNKKFAKWKLLGKKTEWVYPNFSHKYIENKKTVVLVESIGNLISLYECGLKNVLTTFGVELSHKIIEYLLKVDVKKIIIALDNDEKNNMVGNKSAVEMKETLSKYFDDNQIEIITPEFKDFNEWLVKDKKSLEDFCKNL